MEIKDLQQRFNKVEELISSKPWFNEDRLGIHFESYLDLNPKKHKKAYVTLHALHHEEIPGSRISRKKFSQPLVDAIYADVRKWDGYTFRAGKYGLQPFTKFLDATSPQFTIDLTKELERLCKVVGPAIDEVLKSIII